MNPVDPGPTLHRIDRAGRADYEHGHAVAPGVEDRHRGVKQADIGMHRGPHRAARDLGVAVRDRDGGFLVQAQQHLRPLVAEVIDQRIVQAAVARARIERDIVDVECAQGFGDRVASKARGVTARTERTFELAGIDRGIHRRWFAGAQRHGVSSVFLFVHGSCRARARHERDQDRL